MATNRTKYDEQRPKVTPPHVSLTGLRIALGLKQTEVCERVEVILGRPFTKGALSAIENGHRGASTETLSALTTALGLRPGDIATDYQPSHSRRALDLPEAS